MERGGQESYRQFALVLCCVAILAFSSGCPGSGGSTSASGTYSRATLTGPWIIKAVTPGQGTYAIFDGKGTITEFGGNFAARPAGTYQVGADGSVSGVINFNGGAPQSIAGTLTSTTRGVLSTGSEIVKVSSLATCQGAWSGALTETVGGSSVHPISFMVDGNGNVPSFAGIIGPVSGKAFCESDKIVAHFVTNQTGYYEFRIDGSISGSNASGLFKAAPATGTFSLAFEKPGVDNTKAAGTFTYIVTDATNSFTTDRGTLTFDGAGHGTYASLVSADSGTFNYTVTVPGNTLTIDDTTIGIINSAGNFFIAADVTGGSIFLLSGVKHAVSYVDTSATYRGGEYVYSAASPSPSVVTLFSMTTATPPNVFLFSDLTSVETFTTDYSIATNGTWTAHPASPETFGAISEDMNFMIYSDAETALTPERSTGIALKVPGSGMTSASLNGKFMGVEFYDDNAGTGSPFFALTRFTFTFNGNGTGSYYIIEDSAGYTTPAPVSFTYTMNADGTFLIDTFYTGMASQDGSAIVFYDDNMDDSFISIGAALKQ